MASPISSPVSSAPSSPCSSPSSSPRAPRLKFSNDYPPSYHFSESEVCRYLELMGPPPSPHNLPPPSLDFLTQLLRRHLLSFPVENLRLHYKPRDLTPTPDLSTEAIAAKVLSGRRGGYCYELNGAFTRLLLALGFAVRIAAAEVCVVRYQRPDGTYPYAERCHQIILVDFEDANGQVDTFMVDTALSGRVVARPLRLREGEGPVDLGVCGDQMELELIDFEDGKGLVWSLRCRSSQQGKWIPCYRFARNPEVSQEAILRLNVYSSTHPIHMYNHVIFVTKCVELNGGELGRVMLVDEVVETRSSEGRQVVQVLKNETQRLCAFRRLFNIHLTCCEAQGIVGSKLMLKTEEGGAVESKERVDECCPVRCCKTAS